MFLGMSFTKYVALCVYWKSQFAATIRHSFNMKNFFLQKTKIYKKNLQNCIFQETHKQLLTNISIDLLNCESFESHAIFFLLQSVAKELKSLTFANPGKFMDNFDPERSAREMRKMNRRIYREKYVNFLAHLINPIHFYSHYLTSNLVKPSVSSI